MWLISVHSLWYKVSFRNREHPFKEHGNSLPFSGLFWSKKLFLFGTMEK